MADADAPTPNGIGAANGTGHDEFADGVCVHAIHYDEAGAAVRIRRSPRCSVVIRLPTVSCTACAWWPASPRSQTRGPRRPGDTAHDRPGARGACSTRSAALDVRRRRRRSSTCSPAAARSGIEALSRGADALHVRRARPPGASARSTTTSPRSASPTGPRVVPADAVGRRRRRSTVDIVLADPPYDFDDWAQLLARVDAPTCVVAESGRDDRAPLDGWELIRGEALRPHAG